VITFVVRENEIPPLGYPGCSGTRRSGSAHICTFADHQKINISLQPFSTISVHFKKLFPSKKDHETFSVIYDYLGHRSIKLTHGRQYRGLWRIMWVNYQEECINDNLNITSTCRPQPRLQVHFASVFDPLEARRLVLR